MANFPRLNVLRAQMGVVILIWTVVSGWGSGPGGSVGEYPPPANDNFANRTKLGGESVIFSGSLRGSTIEAGEKPTTLTLVQPWFIATSSVWFSWKAPTNGLALVLPSKCHFAFLTVSTGDTAFAAQELQNLIVEIPFNEHALQSRYGTFKVESGVEYQVRVFGDDIVDPFQVAICLTNLPVILQQPRSRTVSPGGAALFSVATVAVSNQLANIQWQFNGTNLPGRTGPILVLTNLSSDDVGEYRAVVTNPKRDESGKFLSKTSGVAQLFVKQPARPVLSIRRDRNGIFVDIQGDVGRSYVLHSQVIFSEDFGNGERFGMYVSDDVFPYPLFGSGKRSHWFFASIREPNSPTCDVNLKQIWVAKNRWAADRNLPMGSEMALDDLKPYIQGQLGCPERGLYSCHPLGIDPTCSLSPSPNHHSLEMQAVGW